MFSTSRPTTLQSEFAHGRFSRGFRRHVQSSRQSTDESKYPKLELSLAQSIEEIGEADWNSCADPEGNPFLSYEFLHALESSKSACVRTGWAPQHVIVKSDGQSRPVAVAPLYIKGHSYGEYVFDSGWAESYDMNVVSGPRYYPKLQSAVPFTPVTGSRILMNKSCGISEEDLFVAVADTMRTLPKRMGVSSIHITFQEEHENKALSQRGWISRTGVQYHWKNQGYSSFDDFLATLKQKKRKSIRQERKKVHSNLVIKRLTGDDLKPHVWDSFYEFYLSTVDKRWGTAYLTREFFDSIGETMANKILLVCAYEPGQTKYPIAAALNLIGKDTLFGRNWGCHPGLYINSLHFELCYYQAIEHAIERQLQYVQAGAQGEHKVQRGYLPTLTHSSHYIANPDFAVAVKDFCRRESMDIRSYAEMLLVHESPYK